MSNKTPNKEEKFLKALIAGYNPYDTILTRNKNVSKVAREMEAEGYTLEKMAALVDQARAHWGLSKIRR